MFSENTPHFYNEGCFFIPLSFIFLKGEITSALYNEHMNDANYFCKHVTVTRGNRLSFVH